MIFFYANYLRSELRYGCALRQYKKIVEAFPNSSEAYLSSQKICKLEKTNQSMQHLIKLDRNRSTSLSCFLLAKMMESQFGPGSLVAMEFFNKGKTLSTENLAGIGIICYSFSYLHLLSKCNFNVARACAEDLMKIHAGHAGFLIARIEAKAHRFNEALTVLLQIEPLLLKQDVQLGSNVYATIGKIYHILVCNPQPPLLESLEGDKRPSGYIHPKFSKVRDPLVVKKRF